MSRTQLKIASYNLYNLNEPGVRIYRDSDGWSADQYRRKIEWSANHVKHIDADVWGFQELWHLQSLSNMFDEAGLLDEYFLLAPDGVQGKRIACAAAVKKGILEDEPEWITDFPAALNLDSQGDDEQTSEASTSIGSFSRPVLHFKIKPRARGKVIHVYVCHFKSKGPTTIHYESWYKSSLHSKHKEAIGAALSTIRRTAEAAALRILLTDRMKGTETPVIVLGDLNDSQQSNTLNIITGQPNYLISGISMGGSDTDLYSTGTLQEYRSRRDVYYTHVYNKTRESLDHILVSQEFYDNSSKRIWAFKGMEIFNDHLNEDNHKDDGSTDHGIVQAEFEYRPAKS